MRARGKRIGDIDFAALSFSSHRCLATPRRNPLLRRRPRRRECADVAELRVRASAVYIRYAFAEEEGMANAVVGIVEERLAVAAREEKATAADQMTCPPGRFLRHVYIWASEVKLRAWHTLKKLRILFDSRVVII